MIVEIEKGKYGSIRKLMENDVGRNYFILLGLTSKKEIYDKIYGEYHGEELKAVLFKRKSGTLQFYAPGKFDENAFVELISSLEYKSLIGARSYCDKFLDKGIFSSSEDGAYISKLDRDYKIKPFEIRSKIRDINLDDLDEIVELYKKVFKSFSPKEVMEEKLMSKRGRGICIEKDEKIISLAQTDFETSEAAVIVGVATSPDHKFKGLATECLKLLSSRLLNEEKNIYLQYDNLEAGKIYERIGFKAIDQVMHYIR